MRVEGLEGVWRGEEEMKGRKGRREDVEEEGDVVDVVDGPYVN